jgi:hypothetical protein
VEQIETFSTRLDKYPNLRILILMAKTLTRADVVVLIQALVREKGTQAAAAKTIGIGSVHIGEVLKGTRDPGPTILRYFDLERETIYKKKYRRAGRL